MARLSELVATMSQVLAVPQQSVAMIARHLREQGYISQKGRGNSAAHVNENDCAALLIGCMAGAQLNRAPDYVTIFRYLPRIYSINDPMYEERYGKFVRKSSVFSESELFWDQVIKLISAAKTDDLKDMIMYLTGFYSMSQYEYCYPLVELEINSTHGEASIKISYHHERMEIQPYSNDCTYYRAEYGQSRNKGIEDRSYFSDEDERLSAATRWSAAYNTLEHGDLSRKNVVTDKTIFALGQLLRS